MNYWAIPGVKFRDHVMIKERVPSCDPDRIINTICDYYKVKRSDISTESRAEDVRLPRQVCMWFLMEYTRLGCIKIGKILGGRDHTTVLHSRTRIRNLIETEPAFKYLINNITEDLYYKICPSSIEQN